MRGNDSQTKVHYRGNNDDYIIFVESAKDVERWKKDKSTPLSEVLNGFKIFFTEGHGNQGVLNTPAKGVLENEFGTSKEDEVIKIILEKGKINETESSARNGVRNESQGGGSNHN